jgi:hypothetical protein
LRVEHRVGRRVAGQDRLLDLLQWRSDLLKSSFHVSPLDLFWREVKLIEDDAKVSALRSIESHSGLLHLRSELSHHLTKLRVLCRLNVGAHCRRRASHKSLHDRLLEDLIW